VEVIPGEPSVNADGLEIAFYAITGSYKMYRNIQIL